MSKGYYSFLICSHDDGAVVNFYVNGIPVGVLDEVGYRQAQIGGRPVTVHNLPEQFPFETFTELTEELHRLVNYVGLSHENEKQEKDKVCDGERAQRYTADETKWLAEQALRHATQ